MFRFEVPYTGWYRRTYRDFSHTVMCTTVHMVTFYFGKLTRVVAELAWMGGPVVLDAWLEVPLRADDACYPVEVIAWQYQCALPSDMVVLCEDG